MDAGPPLPFDLEPSGICEYASEATKSNIRFFIGGCLRMHQLTRNFRFGFPYRIIVHPTASACAGSFNFFHPERLRWPRKGPNRPPPGRKSRSAWRVSRAGTLMDKGVGKHQKVKSVTAKTEIWVSRPIVQL